MAFFHVRAVTASTVLSYDICGISHLTVRRLMFARVTTVQCGVAELLYGACGANLFHFLHRCLVVMHYLFKALLQNTWQFMHR